VTALDCGADGDTRIGCPFSILIPHMAGGAGWSAGSGDEFERSGARGGGADVDAGSGVKFAEGVDALPPPALPGDGPRLRHCSFV